MNRTLLFPLAVLSLLVVGCGGSSSTMKARWDALQLSHYDFELTRSCFCAPKNGTFKVTVQADQVVELKDKETGAVVPLADYPWVRTIDGFFALIDEAEQKGAKVTVSWDQARSYPTDLAIDWVPMAVDDEVSYRLQLNPLTPL